MLLSQMGVYSKRYGRFYMATFLLLAFMTYIIHHMFYSDSSIAGRKQLEAKALHLEDKLVALKQTRYFVEQEALLLRPDTLDSELLEEKARAILMMQSSNEKIILYPTETLPDSHIRQ
ncbi:MAG: septum formation initiator family protein [Alphaproteobacteria bacterium]|nr:septum formation initiator family protein [Alphaproteobacteria bacterium]